MGWFVTYCIFPQPAVGPGEVLGRLGMCVCVCAFHPTAGQCSQVFQVIFSVNALPWFVF